MAAVMVAGVTLLALRHAPTDAAGLCVGRHEVATTMSHDDATRAMQALLDPRPSAAVGGSIDRVWSSPISRCREPAIRLARTWGLTPTLDARVSELDYGAWEGHAWDELMRVDGARVQAWMDTWERSAPPQGESVATLETRVRAWWCELDPGTHVLVAHAGVIRALRVIVGDLSWTEAMQRPVPHLGLERFHR